MQRTVLGVADQRVQHAVSMLRDAWWFILAIGCSANGGAADERLSPNRSRHVDSGSVTPGDDGDDPAPDPGGGDFDVGVADSGPEDASCAASTTNAEPVPLDLLVMLDQSGSMKDATASGTSKWDAVRGAFKTFMADPKTAGLGMGLAYFGQTGLFSDGMSTCSVSSYAKAEIEIAPLPGVSSSIVTSLALHKPYTDTPTGPALQGALQHAQSWESSHPGHVVVVVLATDGMPTACAPQDIPSIASLATAASASGIRTYVIGVLSSDDLTKGAGDNLDQISKAGNGEAAFLIDTKSDVESSFVAALAKIRGTALACEYLVPTGMGVDYGKVNVVVTRGGKKETLPYVGSKDKCDPTKGGWYYDTPPPGTPKKLLTCDATCKSLKSASDGKVDIEVGCATVRPK